MQRQIKKNIFLIWVHLRFQQSCALMVSQWKPSRVFYSRWYISVIFHLTNETKQIFVYLCIQLCVLRHTSLRILAHCPLWDALGWSLAHALIRTCWRRSRDCQKTACTSHLIWLWGRAARARALRPRDLPPAEDPAFTYLYYNFMDFLLRFAHAIVIKNSRVKKML